MYNAIEQILNLPAEPNEYVSVLACAVVIFLTMAMIRIICRWFS